jgi:hypothetical protein
MLPVIILLATQSLSLIKLNRGFQLKSPFNLFAFGLREI